MAMLLLFFMFANAHSATGGGSEDDSLQTQTLTQVSLITELLKHPSLIETPAQQAEEMGQIEIDRYRQEILAIIDDKSYLKITVVRAFVDFVKPITTILYSLYSCSESSDVTECPKGMLGPSGVDERDSRVDPLLFYKAFKSLIHSLPANPKGPLWIEEEEELAEDPRKLDVFTKAFKFLLESLHLYCQNKTESAQKMYDAFSNLLSASTFWQLAQKSIDPYREEILAILTHADDSSLLPDPANQFIRFTEPIEKILEKATTHSRDYLRYASFRKYRFSTEKLYYLDPPLFLQALQFIRTSASSAQGGHLTMWVKKLNTAHTKQAVYQAAAGGLFLEELQSDEEHMKQAVHQAGGFFLTALRDFCHDDWESTANSFNEFLKVDLTRKYT